MDTARYKRRVSPRRQLTTIDLGLTKISPKVDSSQPLIETLPRQAVRPRRVVSDFVSKPPTLPKPEVVSEVEPVQALLANPQPLLLEAPNTVLPLDMSLPESSTDSQESIPLLSAGHRSLWHRTGFRIALASLIVLLVAGGFLFSTGYLKIHKAFKGSAPSVAALKTDVQPSLLKGEGDGRINILLLGRGGGAHDAPDLTDTMILASIDPVNSTATLISIPRDLWVTISGQGSMKINAAWETGEFRYLGKVDPGSTDPAAIQAGFDDVDKIVSAVFGVPINYNAIVDFQAFKQAVDTVGGITVNVPEDLYDPTMAWENNWNSVLAKAGVQTFNGTQALLYVRSRETTSDFARALRQRTVMLALKAKVDTLGTLSNPIKISGLINAFGNNVSTDLSLSDANRLYSIVKNIPDTSITSVGLADPPNHFIMTGAMNGQSIDLPTAGLFNYADIQAFIRTQLKDGHILKENAKILVLNGTTSAGLTAIKASELTSYGYNVVATGVAPHLGWVKTTLVDLSQGRAKYTRNYLEERYNVTAMTSLPDTSIQTNGADFVIILGSDVVTTPKT